MWRLLLCAGDDGDIPKALEKYVDGSAQLPVKTYFIGGYGGLTRLGPSCCSSTCSHACYVGSTVGP
jgi:hypothetical protein